jgi:hypothetical protein
MTMLPEGRGGSDQTCGSGTALKQQAVNVQLHFKSPLCNPPADHQNLWNSSVLTAAQCELNVFPHGKQQQCLTYLSKGYIQSRVWEELHSKYQQPLKNLHNMNQITYKRHILKYIIPESLPSRNNSQCHCTSCSQLRSEVAPLKGTHLSTEVELC